MSRFYLPSSIGYSTIARDTYFYQVESEFKDRTEELLKVYTKAKPRSKNEGGIQLTITGIEGKMRTGKTTFVQLLTEKMVQHYKEDINPIYVKCRPNYSNARLFNAVNALFNNKGIQVLVFDDSLFLSDTPKNESLLINYISNIAHHYYDNTKNDVAIIYIFFIYQVRYKMNPKIRALMDIQIVFGVILERWYLQEDLNIHGEDSVNQRFKDNYKSLMGDYSQIGKGTVLMPLDTKSLISSGKIHLKLPVDYDKKVSDIFMVFVYPDSESEEKEENYLQESDYSNKFASVEAFAGLEDLLIDEFFKQHIDKDYANGIIIDGITKWSYKKATAERYAIQERLRAYVRLVFENKSYKEIAILANEERLQNNLAPIAERSLRDYFSPFIKFFTFKQKFIGGVIEKFVQLKLNELLKRNGFVVQRDYLNCDLVVFVGDNPLLPINIKYSSTHSGGCYPTPEDTISLELIGKYGVIEILTEGETKIYFEIYPANPVTQGQKKVKPKVSYENWEQITKEIFDCLKGN